MERTTPKKTTPKPSAREPAGLPLEQQNASPDAPRPEPHLDLANGLAIPIENGLNALESAEDTLKLLASVFFPDGALNFDFALHKSDPPEAFSTEARYRTLVDQLPAVVFMASFEKGSGEAYVSPQIETSLGYTQSEWLQDPIRWYARIHPDDKARWSAEASEMFISGTPLKSSYRVIARDGHVVWFRCEAKMLRRTDGRPWAIHGVAFDISDLKNAENALLRLQEKLLHDAYHDSLTDLPNRALFLDRLDRALARAKRHKDYKFAVLFIDIDRFKIVNDSLGHHAGDELIVKVSQRILHCLRLADIVCRPVVFSNSEWNTKDDTVARIGGDEFTVLLDDIRDARDGVRVAERIHNSFVDPFIINGQEIFTTVSSGIATNSSATSAADLLRDADTAMYRAKARGKARFEVFDQVMHEEAIERLRLETDLRKALDRDEFLVHYQPIVSLKDGSISGFEALLRWRRSDGRIIAPSEFIAVTEEMGLIVPVGELAFKRSCEQARRWHLLYPDRPMLVMSINISGRQFLQNDLVSQVEKMIDEAEVEPTSIKLEITESVMMGDAERTIKVIRDLKRLGIRISIDDFGTGYSSLSYLRRFPIDTLKIDRSFVRSLESNAENRAIVHTISSLARTLGMDVVAEGAETAEEVTHLVDLECEFAQGYFFCRPTHSDQVQVLLQQNKTFDLSPNLTSPGS